MPYKGGGGRFGSSAFAMKNRHFGGECSWILAVKARKCGRFWVFACVPNPGKQSIWRQCPPSARKRSTKKTAKSSRFCPCTGGGVVCHTRGVRMPYNTPLYAVLARHLSSDHSVSLALFPTSLGVDALGRQVCTRLQVPPVALHVSQLISWILLRFAGVAPVSRHTP